MSFRKTETPSVAAAKAGFSAATKEIPGRCTGSTGAPDPY
jgi:hypothetical protein